MCELVRMNQGRRWRDKCISRDFSTNVTSAVGHIYYASRFVNIIVTNYNQLGPALIFNPYILRKLVIEKDLPMIHVEPIAKRLICPLREFHRIIVSAL